VHGFGFMLMTRAETGWVMDLHDSDGNPTRQCRFTDARSGLPPRLDCPKG